MRVERHGYRFTNKYNTKGGIRATVLAVVALILLVTGIVIAYKKEGSAGSVVGMIGTASFIFATTGLILGLRSFKEKDGFYLFSWIGTISCGVLWLALCGIIAWGL